MIRKEFFPFVSHAVSAVIAFAGAVVLAVLAKQSSIFLAVSMIYGVSVVMLFSFSAVYHAKKREENENTIWRKMDHLAIFIMIAGSYTAICFFNLERNLCLGIVIAQWALVLAGIFFKFFYLSAPRFISTIIYLAMGWMSIFIIRHVTRAMSASEIISLVTGGIFYTIGAVIYIKKKPDILPCRIGFHGLFHIFVILGWICHFYLVLLGLRKSLVSAVV